MYLFLCVSVLCLMFLCVIPVLCLWALLPELKLMMMMISANSRPPLRTYVSAIYSSHMNCNNDG